MKTTIIVDTDVITEYLKTGKGSLPGAYEKFSMVISAATLLELLASKTFVDESLAQEVKEFVDKYFVIKEIDRKVAEKAAEIIREREVTMATALVAATALVFSHKILTNNPDEYNRIDGIEFA